MTIDKQMAKLQDLFYKSQSRYAYYTVALCVLMIGYISNIILTTSENLLIFPIVSLVGLVFCLFCGLFFIRYRTSNFYNTVEILKKIKEHKEDKEITKIGLDQIEKNGSKQEVWFTLHYWFLIISPIIYFIWLFILKIHQIF